MDLQRAVDRNNMKGFYNGLKEVWGPKKKGPIHLKSTYGIETFSDCKTDPYNRGSSGENSYKKSALSRTNMVFVHGTSVRHSIQNWVMAATEEVWIPREVHNYQGSK